MKVLSLGAGVNSTALLVLKVQGKVDFDLAIFADTGGEQPETYQYIEEVIKPFCEKHNITFVVVKRDGLTLYEKQWEEKLIPLRMYRSCSDKFKIRVIRKYLLTHYPKEQITNIVGFCKGEEKRAEKSQCGVISPLIDLGIDREGCKRIIKDAGLPIPIKSGCYFCPHQPMKSWLSLLKSHPELYAKAEALEKNGPKYPSLFLSYEYPLETIRKGIKNQKALCAFPFESPCPMCELENNEEVS